MMQAIHHTLFQALVAPFYRRHAGLFLFLFFLLFGIQPSFADALRLHYAIIQSILHSPVFFGVAAVIWAGYTARVIGFVRGCLQKETYDFLFLLNALPQRQRLTGLLRLHTILLAPAGCYGLLVAGIAFKEQQVAAGILFLLMILLLHGLVVLIALLSLQKAKGIREVTLRWQLPFSIRPGLASFILRFILQKQFAPLVLIKLLSFCSLYFFVQLEDALFEGRMLWLLFLTMLVGHSLVVYRNFWFIENELSFYRNMPVQSIRTLASLLLVYMLLLLPEVWALRGLSIVHHQAADYGWMVLTGPLFLLLIHVLLYTEDMEMSEWLKLLFGIWLVFVLFSLSRHHWLIPAISGSFAVLLFRICYRRYEKNAAVGKTG